MPDIHPIPAVLPTDPTSDARADNKVPDVSDRIAPPYDVLNAQSKGGLMERSEHNIAAIDLPHLPAKTVGPDSAYEGAGELYRAWLEQGLLTRRNDGAMYVYQQTYSVPTTGPDSTRDRIHRRRGLFANVTVQPFGPGASGHGGIYPHEQTFSAAKEDRLKLMRATGAQLSPIFGIFRDDDGSIASLLNDTIAGGEPSLRGTTEADGVLHELWEVSAHAQIAKFKESLAPRDVFIADGHHRYTTALNYRNERLAHDHSDPGLANFCLFVLVSMQDPGMIVLPTHRIVRGMTGYTIDKLLTQLAARPDVAVEETQHGGDDLPGLEAVLPERDHHAMGLYDPASGRTFVLTTSSTDPLAELLPGKPAVWRGLDVAVLHELLIDRVLRPHFAGGQAASDEGPEAKGFGFKYTADVGEVRTLAGEGGGEGHEGGRLAILVQPTPLESVRGVSESGEVMPQKSTYFYPKLATGLVINPLT